MSVYTDRAMELLAKLSNTGLSIPTHSTADLVDIISDLLAEVNSANRLAELLAVQSSREGREVRHLRAAIARVEKLADEWDEDGMIATWRACVAELRAALNQPPTDGLPNDS